MRLQPVRLSVLLVRLPVLVCALGVWRPALAIDWVRVGGNASVVEVYVNRHSIQRTGSNVKLWAMWDFAATQYSADESKTPFRSHKTLLLVRCDRRELAVARFVLYTENLGGGEQFGEQNTPRADQRFLKVDPTTISATIADMVCRTGRRKQGSS